MMSYESNIPFYGKKTNRGFTKTLRDCKIGDSFLWNFATREQHKCAVVCAQKAGLTMTSQRENYDGEYRVWRGTPQEMATAQRVKSEEHK